MDEPLIDSQGFPRADIDVYQVRHARAAIRGVSSIPSILFSKGFVQPPSSSSSSQLLPMTTSK